MEEICLFLLLAVHLPSIMAKLLILYFNIILFTSIITFNNESNGIPTKMILSLTY